MPEYVTLGNCGCPCGPVPCIESSTWTVEAPAVCGHATLTRAAVYDRVWRVKRIIQTNQNGTHQLIQSYTWGSAPTCEPYVITGELEPISSAGLSREYPEITDTHRVEVDYNTSGILVQTTTIDLFEPTDQFTPALQFNRLEDKARELSLDDLARGEHRTVYLDFDGNECERDSVITYPQRNGALYDDRFPAAQGGIYRKARVFVSLENNQETCCFCEYDEAYDIFGGAMKTRECFQTNHRRVGGNVICTPLVESLVIDITPIHIAGALYERIVGQASVLTPPCCIE